MSDFLLQAESLSAGYNKQPVIAGLSFGARAGEFVGIIGANGSGKSTVLRTFSRILKPLQGAVMVEGEDIWRHNAPWLARRLAVVPQDSTVAFDFTVLETVLMGRFPHLGRFSIESSQDHEIAWKSLQQTKMENLANRPLSAVSGGERRRAVIARALAQQPQILLADEPIAHLDINHQIQILDLLQNLSQNSGVAVVSALHDLNLASLYCDRLVMLAGGHALAIGAPAEVITEDNVRHAYGIHAQVKPHPTTGRPYITLAGRHYPASHPKPAQGAQVNAALPTVHVICGAGTGSQLIEQLVSEGYDVSVGVVNVADSDQQIAETLDLDRVEEAPFSAISDDACRHNIEMARAADVVIVCAVPVGEGNLANLQAAQEALAAGRRVLLGNYPPIETRDFTGGRAAKLFQELAAAGAQVSGECAPHP